MKEDVRSLDSSSSGPHGKRCQTGPVSEFQILTNLYRFREQMVVSRNEGPQYSPKYIILLIIGTPKKVPLILGTPQITTAAIDAKTGELGVY